MIKTKKGELHIKASDGAEVITDMAIIVRGCRDYLVNVCEAKVEEANAIVSTMVAAMLAEDVSDGFTVKEGK